MLAKFASNVAIFYKWFNREEKYLLNDIDLVVFNMNEPGNIVKAVRREVNGTTITKKK